jgi:nucleoside-diphosphate-sugar epimerase
VAITRDERQAWELRKFLFRALGEKQYHRARFETVADDLSDPRRLGRFFLGASDVIHLAATIDYGASLRSMINANAVPARNVAEACAATGSRMILMSSTSVARKSSALPITEDDAPSPANAYGKSKLLSEEAVRASGCAHVIARFPIIYGEGFSEGFSQVVKMAREGTLRIIGGGGNKISFINIADAVSAYDSVLAHREVDEGVFYFVGESLPQAECYGRICAALGVAPPKKRVSRWVAMALARARGVLHRLRGKKPALSAENIGTLADNREFSCQKARETFGWGPRVRLGKESLGPYLKPASGSFYSETRKQSE